MQALLLAVVLVSSNLDELNKYKVYQNAIVDSQNQTLANLERYGIYNTSFRHNSLYDDGQQLRLYSTFGYFLENIPLYSNRFYNECVEIFLEIEKRIPRAYECMLSNGQNPRPIKGLRFSFPKNPQIRKDNVTFFKEYAVTYNEKKGVYKVDIWR